MKIVPWPGLAKDEMIFMPPEYAHPRPGEPEERWLARVRRAVAGRKILIVRGIKPPKEGE